MGNTLKDSPQNLEKRPVTIKQNLWGGTLKIWLLPDAF